MCRIPFVRTRLAVFCFTGVCLTLAMPALGEQPQDAAAQLGPLEILHDCIQAVEKRDFQRYVDHLAPDEQRVQAAYALQAISTMSQSFAYGASVGDPNMLLLSRALSDRLRRHTVPVEQRNEKHAEAENALAGIPGAAHGIPRRLPALIAYPAPSDWATTQQSNREAYRKAAGILDDPRQFLVTVLAEVAQPSTISGEQPDKVENSFDYDEVVKAYQLLKWTLYTRGDYAIAVPLAPPADEQSEKIAVPGQAPISPSSNVDSLRIEFQRIDGSWKISKLIQLFPLHPVGGLAGSGYYAPASFHNPQFNPYSSQIAR